MTTLAVAGLALAACSGGATDDDSGPGERPEAGDEDASGDPAGGAGDAPAMSLTELVGGLPTPRSERLVVHAADLAAASATAGLEYPPTDGRQWAMDLTTATQQTGVFVPLPGGFLRELQAGVDPELGWTLPDTRGFAHVSAPPEETLLVVGVGEEDLAETVGPFEAGILTTAGPAGDHETDLTATTPLRQVGAPLRLVPRDDATLVTTSTAAARGFVDGDGATLAGHGAVMAAVTALEGAVTASVLSPPMTADAVLGPVLDPERLSELDDLPLVTAPPLAVALGTVATDDGVQLLAAYVFGNGATAEEQEEHVGRVWQEGTLDGRRPLTELVRLEEVSWDGATVVATLAPVEGVAAQHLDPTNQRGALPFTSW